MRYVTALQQSHLLQRPTDPLGDLLHHVLELLALRRPHPPETQPAVGARRVHAVQAEHVTPSVGPDSVDPDGATF